MIVSKIYPLKAVLYPEEGGGINALISRIILFCCGKQTFFTKKLNYSIIANYFNEGKTLDRKWVNNWAVT